MRTIHSSKNLLFSLSITLVTILLGFITRQVFISNIGIEYLGLNGLLSNILGAVTLLESGFGLSITYNLYKPLAEGNEKEVIALVQLYNRVYRYIALGIFTVSMTLLPFLDYFINDTEKPAHITIIFILFVINTLIPYFTAHKRALISSDQRNYKLATIDLLFHVFSSILKISILYFVASYILFLSAEVILLLITNLALSRKVNRLYPYIKTNIKYEIDVPTKRKIKEIVRASFISGLGGYFMYSSSNILISKYVSLTAVGLYSNYKLLSDSTTGIVNQFINCSSASIGNLIASCDTAHVYRVYRSIMLLNFIVAMTAGCGLFHLFNPFISLWIGEEFCFPVSTVFLIVLFFLLNALRLSIFTFKTKAGIYHPDRYTALFQGIINVVVALILVHHFDIDGILAAMNISVLAIGFWQTPRLVYKMCFKKPLYLYFCDYLMFLSGGVISCIALHFFKNAFYPNQDLTSFVINGVACVIMTPIIYSILFCKSEAFIFMIKHIHILILRKRM